MISKKANIAKSAIINDDVVIEDNVTIHDFVVIYPGVTIKSGSEVFENSSIGKIPKSSGSTAKSYSDEFNTTIIGENCVLCPGSIIYTGVNIENNTLLGDNCSIRENCTIGEYCIISRNVTVNYDTKIGNFTKIMDNSHITGNMVVGNNVFISVLVGTTNDNSMGRNEDAISQLRGPIIEDNVTIGAGAMLLPGVKIGNNSIVGASALVTKDVPSNKVVMGVPAKVIRDV